jgi:hypothetical protein
MKQFVRDSTVHISITFRDRNGTAVVPPSADVTLSYMPIGGGDPTNMTYALAQDADDDTLWFYDWDSSVAEPCVITGHAETIGLTARSTVDFEFRLTANRANRMLVGE